MEEAKREARRNRDAVEKNRVKEELRAAERERNKITDEITNAYVPRAMSGQLAADMSKGKPHARCRVDHQGQREAGLGPGTRHAGRDLGCFPGVLVEGGVGEVI